VAPACSPTASRPRPSSSVRDSAVLGLQGAELTTVNLDLASVNHRVKGLAMAQSADIHARLSNEGVRIVAGQGRLSDEIRGLAAHKVEVVDAEGEVAEELESDVVLIATGADPRVLPGAEPDGERILDWRDVYDLEEMPEHLVVVGSGVTGAEFASGYLEAGVPVTWCPPATRCCPVRTPTRPPSSRRSSSPAEARSPSAGVRRR
jgi:pyruvate/2-oxoglutarate dehydrogenase complex dihydrolipoamide dehydrogenase (E3) component